MWGRVRETGPTSWPRTPDELAREQERLASLGAEPWEPGRAPLRIGACAVVSGRAGLDGTGWAAAVVDVGGALSRACTAVSRIEAPFRPGLLALREGPALEAVVRGLEPRPDVLLVAASGRDHPLGAGLALHLGAVLDVPTVGVTDGPLVASGGEPPEPAGSLAPLRVGGQVVAYRVRTRAGAKPIVAHAAWRTSAEVAARVVLACTALARWPRPLREARRLAREARSGDAQPGRSQPPP